MNNIKITELTINDFEGLQDMNEEELQLRGGILGYVALIDEKTKNVKGYAPVNDKGSVAYDDNGKFVGLFDEKGNPIK